MEFIKTTLLSKNDNPVFIVKTKDEAMLAEEIAENYYIIYSQRVTYGYDALNHMVFAPQYLLNTIFKRGE